MKLIINASGTKATGVTQVTVSFIKECMYHSENQYYVFMSRTVASQLDKSEFPDNFYFYEFDYKPFFNLKGLKTWLKLIKLEKQIRPNCVFSVFGPSVWQPRSPHLMGYAYPYYVYPESPFFSVISRKRKFIIWLHKMFHKYFLQKNGKHYVSETEDVTRRLPNFLNCDVNKLYTVTNTYNHYFEDFKPSRLPLLPPPSEKEFRFVTLSSFSSHKNLTVLNEVIPKLTKKLKDVEIKFILTIDKKIFAEKFTSEAINHIYNLGRIDISDCPQAYYESDAMFLPTLMECFSASYAEAMKMGKPIATSNLTFATVVCNDAAIYFDPMNSDDITNILIELITNKELQSSLIEKGYKQLELFDTASSRASKYLSICKKLAR